MLEKEVSSMVVAWQNESGQYMEMRLTMIPDTRIIFDRIMGVLC